MRNASGACSDMVAFSPARQLERVESNFLEDPGERFVVGQIDAGTPENLAIILDCRQRMRIMRGDEAHARADRERHFDHLVERRLVTCRAKRAGILLMAHGFQRRAAVEHAAATRTQHVPCQFEETQPRGVEKRGDRLLFVESALRRKVERVDATEISVATLPHQRLDGVRRLGGGRLSEYRK